MTALHHIRGGFVGLSALVGLLIVAAPAYAQDCKALLERFNSAIDVGRESSAQQLVDQIATDSVCGQYQVNVQRRLAGFRLSAAQLLMARGRPVADYERLLTDADRAQVLWQAAATLGDVRFGERRFPESAMAFDRAIEIIKNSAMTPTVPSTFEVEGLFARAAQSRLLAANTSTQDEAPSFVAAAHDKRDGRLGGLYSPSVRGIVPRAIPIPITFEFAKTAFTAVGEQAVQELVTALKEQQPGRIILVGHTDVRGSAEGNLRLSRERAEAVADYLHQNGIDATIETVGKGATEPMQIQDASGLTQDDIYALNRRVEWRRD